MVDVAHRGAELTLGRLEAGAIGREALDGVVAGVGGLIQADGMEQVGAQWAMLRSCCAA